MLYLFCRRIFWLLPVLMLPGLVAAADKKGQGAYQADTQAADASAANLPRSDQPLLAPLILPGLMPPDIEPVLIRFEDGSNRFVGTVDMERFLRPGLGSRASAAAQRRYQVVSEPFFGREETIVDSDESLRKSAVFNWSLSGLVRVSLDVIAARGLQVAANPASSSEGIDVQVLGGSGKNPGGQSFSYAAPASSIGTAGPGSSNLLPGGDVTAFSLQGYQLGVSSSLDLGGDASLGFDFGLGQALSRDVNNEAARQLTITSLGVGLEGKRFRARVNSDLFTSGQSLDPSQQSSVGVQFDWQFDDSTLSVGARRPLSMGSSVLGQSQDFSTTIPYIRYRKEL